MSQVLLTSLLFVWWPLSVISNDCPAPDQKPDFTLSPRQEKMFERIGLAKEAERKKQQLRSQLVGDLQDKTAALKQLLHDREQEESSGRLSMPIELKVRKLIDEIILLTEVLKTLRR